METFMKIINRKTLFAWAAVAVLSLMSAPLLAATEWTGSGPGTIDFTSGIDSSPQFTYSVNPAGFAPVTWDYHTTADTEETVGFEYTYSGFHAFFAVTVTLRAYIIRDGVTTYYPLLNRGPANCCTEPSNGFNYTGGVSLRVQPGDVYGFELGGSNGDVNNVLSGELDLNYTHPIPTLSQWGLLVFILLTGLTAVFVLRRDNRLA